MARVRKLEAIMVRFEINTNELKAMEEPERFVDQMVNAMVAGLEVDGKPAEVFPKNPFSLDVYIYAPVDLDYLLLRYFYNASRTMFAQKIGKLFPGLERDRMDIHEIAEPLFTGDVGNFAIKFYPSILEADCPGEEEFINQSNNPSNVELPKERSEKTNENAFIDELAVLINKYSLENRSNTPDFILAEYMVDCLRSFERTSNVREHWYDTFLGPEKVKT